MDISNDQESLFMHKHFEILDNVKFQNHLEIAYGPINWHRHTKAKKKWDKRHAQYDVNREGGAKGGPHSEPRKKFRWKSLGDQPSFEQQYLRVEYCKIWEIKRSITYD